MTTGRVRVAGGIGPVGTSGERALDIGSHAGRRAGSIRVHRPDGSYPFGMPGEHSKLISAMREAVDASANVRDGMITVERSLLEGINDLEGGAGVMETLTTSRVKELRLELQAALDLVTRTRHEFRLALVSECVANGLSTHEISELWGFSRQRAALLVHEVGDLTSV